MVVDVIYRLPNQPSAMYRYTHMHSCFNNERFSCFTLPPFPTSCAICASNKSAARRPTGIGRAIGVLRGSIAHASVLLVERWARTAHQLCRHHQWQLRSGSDETGNAARWVRSNDSSTWGNPLLCGFDRFDSSTDLTFTLFFSTLFSDPNTESLKSDTDSGRICALWCDFFRQMTSAPIIALVPTR